MDSMAVFAVIEQLSGCVLVQSVLPEAYNNWNINAHTTSTYKLLVYSVHYCCKMILYMHLLNVNFVIRLFEQLISSCNMFTIGIVRLLQL